MSDSEKAHQDSHTTISTLRRWIQGNVEFFGQTVVDYPAKQILGETRADHGLQVREFIDTLEANVEAYKKLMEKELPHACAADRRGIKLIICRTERVIKKAKSLSLTLRST